MFLSCWVSIFFGQRGPHVMRHLSPVTCHQSYVTCWPLFDTLIVLPNISIQHIMSVTLPTAMWILPMCFLILKLDHCLAPQKKSQKTCMFPWLPDINLFNVSGGSHGKLLNSVVFFHFLAPQPSPRPSPAPWPSSCSPPGGSFLRKSGGTKEVDD